MSADALKPLRVKHDEKRMRALARAVVFHHAWATSNSMSASAQAVALTRSRASDSKPLLVALARASVLNLAATAKRVAAP